jgi:hypothetical protein
MCIISDSVKRVAATKLFGMPSLDNTRQLTVYTNTVDTAATNVMCLPVPSPDTVKFEKVPKDLFKQCDQSIIKLQQERSGGPFMLCCGERGYLDVQSHGSYDVVVSPSMTDLDRVPSTFATLTPEVIQFLRTNYPGDFGVILCRLRIGSVNYEPFAYSHALVGSKLFLPTKHYHRHDDGDFVMGRSYNQSSSIHADWDHEVYTMMTEPRVAHNVGPKRIPKPRNEIVWSAMPLAYRVGANAHVKLFEVKGSDIPNQDLSFRVENAWITS